MDKIIFTRSEVEAGLPVILSDKEWAAISRWLIAALEQDLLLDLQDIKNSGNHPNAKFNKILEHYQNEVLGNEEHNVNQCSRPWEW